MIKVVIFSLSLKTALLLFLICFFEGDICYGTLFVSLEDIIGKLTDASQSWFGKSLYMGCFFCKKGKQRKKRKWEFEFENTNIFHKSSSKLKSTVKKFPLTASLFCSGTFLSVSPRSSVVFFLLNSRAWIFCD